MQIKSISFLLFIILITYSLTTSAQSKHSKRNSTDQKISSETRISSAQFADGIKEFYSNNLTAAETIFREVIIANPQNDAAYYLLSKVRTQKNDYSGALPYLLDAIKINDKNIWYEVDLANLFEKMGDYRNAEKSWIKVCKTVTNNEYYFYALASIYLKNEKYEEAIQAFEKMEEIIGYNADLVDTKKNIWLYLNQVEKAVQEYKKWMELYPYDMTNYVTVAQIYNANGMPQKGIEILQKGLALDSSNIEILSVFITIYKSTQEKEKEEYFIDKLIHQKDQNNTIYQILKGRTQTINKNNKKESLNKAITEFELYCGINPENGEALGLLAQLYFINNDEIKSLQYCELAIKNNELTYDTWYIYLSLLFKEQKYQEIVQKADNIEQLFPTQSNIQVFIGYAFSKLDNYDQAIKWFKTVLTYSFEDSMSAQITEELGNIYEIKKNKEEALKYWKMSQKYGNKSDKLKEKISKIQ
jgi:tetratricopeptide (TPR) repeat protein